MEYTIYVSYKDGTKNHRLIGGFNSAHEAMTWLVDSYQVNADFWKQVYEVVISER